MPEPGYVYVLYNPALNGLVKIGRTSKNPKDRAAELSTSTGIPAPFEVVFEAYFADSEIVERAIHSLLTTKGFRRASNREFFEIPISDAVKIVVEAQSRFPTGPIRTVTEPVHNGLSSFDAILDLADALFHGNGDTLQDEQQALELYQKALSGGSVRSAITLAELWICGKAQFPIQDVRRWLEKATSNGSLEAWGFLAILMAKAQHAENNRKCWDRFFERFHELLRLRQIYWGNLYLINTPAGDVTPGHRESLRALREDLRDDNRDDRELQFKAEVVLFPEIVCTKLTGRVYGIRHGVVGINSGGTLFFGRPFEVKLGCHVEEGSVVSFVADPLAKPPIALDIRPQGDR